MLLRDIRDADIPAIAAIDGRWATHGLARFEEPPPPPAELARGRHAVLPPAMSRMGAGWIPCR